MRISRVYSRTEFLTGAGDRRVDQVGDVSVDEGLLARDEFLGAAEPFICHLQPALPAHLLPPHVPSVSRPVEAGWTERAWSPGRASKSGQRHVTEAASVLGVNRMI